MYVSNPIDSPGILAQAADSRLALHIYGLLYMGRNHFSKSPIILTAQIGLVKLNNESQGRRSREGNVLLKKGWACICMQTDHLVLSK